MTAEKEEEKLEEVLHGISSMHLVIQYHYPTTDFFLLNFISLNFLATTSN